MTEQVWRVDQRTRRPFCQQAGIKPLGSSRRLQRALTDFGADEAFAPAAAKVQEHYGITVSVDRVRRTTYAHAECLVQQTPAPSRALPARGAEVIVAEADGSMVPTVSTATAPEGADRRRHRRCEWQEVRLLAAQAQGEVRTHYGATMQGVDAAGDLWENAVGAAGRGLHTRVHGVGDGAPWIANQCLGRFAPQASYLLDLFHVCDYLAAVWPGDRESVHRHRDHLKAGEVAVVLSALRARLEPPETPDELAPARRALRYLENRPGQLDYPAALAAGLPVGSGLIESGHRHVLQRRLKLSGAWWLPENVHRMAQLRTTRANGGYATSWSKN